MEELFTTQNLIAFLTLTGLEIVLGIDNVIFIAILSGKLPVEQQKRARTLGISLAVITRILLLFAISWVMQLTTPLFWDVSGRDLILIVGGAFLIGKSTFEIHEKIEAADHKDPKIPTNISFTSVIIQIVLVDIIFSLDSVITAVGISGNMVVMVSAIIIAAAFMLFFAGAISSYVERHPTMKILALAFLILIGTLLVTEGLLPEDVAHELHLKNYAYFAMAFSVLVEFVNMRFRGSQPVHLHNQPTLATAQAEAVGGSGVSTKYEEARPATRPSNPPRKSKRKR